MVLLLNQYEKHQLFWGMQEKTFWGMFQLFVYIHNNRNLKMVTSKLTGFIEVKNINITKPIYVHQFIPEILICMI